MNQRSESLIEQTEHSLILSSRVIGTPVFDRAGTCLGELYDLSIDKAGGRVVYAIMSFGGFLGIGEKFHPVPWAVLDYDVERAGFVALLDSSKLKDAPNYELGELHELGDNDYHIHGKQIYGHYGLYGAAPFW